MSEPRVPRPPNIDNGSSPSPDLQDFIQYLEDEADRCQTAQDLCADKIEEAKLYGAEQTLRRIAEWLKEGQVVSK